MRAKIGINVSIALILLAFALQSGQGNAVNQTATLANPRLQTVNLIDFGAKGDGKTDDTEAVNKAVQRAAELAKASTNVLLQIPPGGGFVLTKPLVIPGGVSIEQYAPLIYRGNEPKAFVTIGSEDKRTYASYRGLSVVKERQSRWLKDDPGLNQIGIRIYNANGSQIEIDNIENFTVGLECIGSGDGFVYNELHLGRIAANHIGFRLTNANFGWINENLIYGGSFAVWSDVNNDQSRYGIVITSADGSYKNNNNNVFIKPSFELSQKKLDAGREAVPIVIEHGKYNTFEYVRNEGNGDVLARMLNESSYNSITTGWGDAAIDDRSTYPFNIGLSAVDRLEREFSRGVLAADLAKGAVSAGSGSGSGSGNGSSNGSGSGSDGKATSRLTYLDRTGKVQTSISVGCMKAAGQWMQFEPGCSAVGSYVDASATDSFLITRQADNQAGGRVVVKGYDKDGKELNGSAEPWLKSREGRAPYWNAERFGGVYQSGKDGAESVFISVSPKVRKLWIGVTAGSGQAKISRFEVKALPTDR